MTFDPQGIKKFDLKKKKTSCGRLFLKLSLWKIRNTEKEKNE